VVPLELELELEEEEELELKDEECRSRNDSRATWRMLGGACTLWWRKRMLKEKDDEDQV
jgi:hypothetical protein